MAEKSVNSTPERASETTGDLVDLYTLQLEELKLRHEIYKQERLDYNHRSRVTADFALSAIRTALIANGAATLSTLTFVSTLTASQRPTHIDLDVVARSLYLFALGTGMATIVVAIGYIARIFRSDRHALFYRAMTVVGVLSGLTSLGLFFRGIINMRHALDHIKTTFFV